MKTTPHPSLSLTANMKMEVEGVGGELFGRGMILYHEAAETQINMRQFGYDEGRC